MNHLTMLKYCVGHICLRYSKMRDIQARNQLRFYTNFEFGERLPRYVVRILEEYRVNKYACPTDSFTTSLGIVSRYFDV